MNSTDKSQSLRLKNLSDLTTVQADKIISTFLTGSQLTQWVRESLLDVIKKKSESYGCQYNHRQLCRLEYIAIAQFSTCKVVNDSPNQYLERIRGKTDSIADTFNLNFTDGLELCLFADELGVSDSASKRYLNAIL